MFRSLTGSLDKVHVGVEINSALEYMYMHWQYIVKIETYILLFKVYLDLIVSPSCSAILLGMLSVH